MNTKEATRKYVAVVRRLKEADAAESRELRERGFAAGEVWARDTATKRQLRRLAKHVKDHEADELIAQVFGRANESRCLFHAINGVAEDYRDWGADFWEEAVGEAGAELIDEDEDFAAGFVEGALSVWGHVERFV